MKHKARELQELRMRSSALWMMILLALLPEDVIATTSEAMAREELDAARAHNQNLVNVMMAKDRALKANELLMLRMKHKMSKLQSENNTMQQKLKSMMEQIQGLQHRIDSSIQHYEGTESKHGKKTRKLEERNRKMMSELMAKDHAIAEMRREVAMMVHRDDFEKMLWDHNTVKQDQERTIEWLNQQNQIMTRKVIELQQQLKQQPIPQFAQQLVNQDRA